MELGAKDKASDILRLAHLAALLRLIRSVDIWNSSLGSWDLALEILGQSSESPSDAVKNGPKECILDRTKNQKSEDVHPATGRIPEADDQQKGANEPQHAFHEREILSPTFEDLKPVFPLSHAQWRFRQGRDEFPLVGYILLENGCDRRRARAGFTAQPGP